MKRSLRGDGDRIPGIPSRGRVLGLAAMLAFPAATEVRAGQVLAFRDTVCDFDRWMYPFNATPGTRASASVFGVLDPGSGADSRDGQFLVGWTTSGTVPPDLAPSRYRVLRASVTLTINRDRAWRYDGTPDPFGSFLPAGDPGHVADPDEGRPVELFGVGFRNGFSAATFPEDGPFVSGGGGMVGTRNAFAAGYLPDGRWVDVSNNVGKTNPVPFEVRPFAVGTVDGVQPGEPVPAGTRMRFELDPADPGTGTYLVESLRSGRLRLAVTSLASGSFTGAPTFPQFHTRDSFVALDADRPLLDLEVEILPQASVVMGVGRRAGQVVLTFAPAPSGPLAVEVSEDLSTWREQVVEPVRGSREGESEWVAPVSEGARFFRIRE